MVASRGVSQLDLESRLPSWLCQDLAIENGDLVRGFTHFHSWWIFPVRDVNVYQGVVNDDFIAL